ncbi:hypothetical protein FQA39_LY13018 [Lamprigera yunnana]|nr:hypothetical protein FQA39_LY13018 [Lamprigera yunnana]
MGFDTPPSSQTKEESDAKKEAILKIADTMDVPREKLDKPANSFNPGAGSTVSRNMLDNGVNVIMGVAGPQTADIINAIRTKNKTDADLFITSAEKDIVHSTALSIAHSPQYLDEMIEKGASIDGENTAEFSTLINETLGGGLTVSYEDKEKG